MGQGTGGGGGESLKFNESGLLVQYFWWRRFSNLFFSSFFKSIAPLLKKTKTKKQSMSFTYEECFVPNFVEICLVLLEKRWKCNLEENRKISNRKIMSHRLRWAKKSQSIFILICLLKRIWIFSSVFKSKNILIPLFQFQRFHSHSFHKITVIHLKNWIWSWQMSLLINKLCMIFLKSPTMFFLPHYITG